MKIISVFGSAMPQAGSADYEQALTVGRLLAERGFGVATGGYSGTMEAVSRGAQMAGGHVIGVTTGQLDRIRTIAANGYLSEQVAYASLLDRMLHLVRHNDGMIALPGGIGTLTELALAWEFMRVQEIPDRPLVALGPLWRQTLEAFVRDEYIAAEHVERLLIADSAEEAVELISARVG